VWKLKVDIVASKLKEKNEKKKKKSSIKLTTKVTLKGDENKKTIVYLFIAYTDTRVLRNHSKI